MFDGFKCYCRTFAIVRYHCVLWDHARTTDRNQLARSCPQLNRRVHHPEHSTGFWSPGGAEFGRKKSQPRHSSRGLCAFVSLRSQCTAFGSAISVQCVPCGRIVAQLRSKRPAMLPQMEQVPGHDDK